MDELISPAERRRRHAAWLESFGFSDEDRRRIRELVADTNPNYSPAGLGDLSVPYRVGACMAAGARHTSGQLLGVIDGRAVLAWKLVGRELETWRRVRRGRG